MHVFVIARYDARCAPGAYPVLGAGEEHHCALADVRLLNHVAEDVVAAMSIDDHELVTPARPLERSGDVNDD